MASITALVELGLFSIQSLLWPAYFHSYLRAASLNPAYLGFGLSPAGLLGEWLYKQAPRYERVTILFYLAYAIPLLFSLAFLSRGYLQGRIPFKRWVPVMLIGVTLLNPRLKEYDVSSITIPLALVAWRIFSRFKKPTVRNFLYGLLFVTANLAAVTGLAGANSWNLEMCFIVTGIFVAGFLSLRLEEESVNKLADPD